MLTVQFRIKIQWPLTALDRWLLFRGQLYRIFHQEEIKWPHMKGDCLIGVAASAVLTVFIALCRTSGFIYHVYVMDLKKKSCFHFKNWQYRVTLKKIRFKVFRKVIYRIKDVTKVIYKIKEVTKVIYRIQEVTKVIYIEFKRSVRLFIKLNCHIYLQHKVNSYFLFKSK